MKEAEISRILANDFDGHPIVGLPDIGAYEYQSGGDTQAPSALQGLAVW